MRAADVGYFCHGTTVGTNALLEGKGVKTGLLVTEGFRGIYEVAEQARPYGTAIFDVMYDKPAPLVPPSLTGEVRERVDFRGNVLVPLDEAALRETLRGLKAQKIEALAVCLLFSFLHPAARSARARDRARGNAGLQRFAVVGDSAADPRVLPAVARRSSTPICSRSWRATSRISTAASPAPASPRGRNTSCSRTAACRPSPKPRAQR